MKNKVETINTNTDLFRMLKGLFLSIGFTILALFLFAIILTYSNVQENTIPPVIIVITVISILLGSSISMRKLKKNGILKGGIIGIVYLLILYSISSTFSGDFALSVSSIIMMIGGVIAGAIGGVIGVNRK